MSGRPNLQSQRQSTPREKFLAAAKDISDDYRARLSKKMIQKLEKEDTDLFFDIHAHCFTFQNVPKNFTRLQLIKVPHQFLVSGFYKLIARLFKEPDSGLLAFFSVGAYYNSTLITKKLLNIYHQFFSSKKETKHFVVVMLSMNMEYGISQEIPENHEKQLQDLTTTCQFFASVNNLKYSASIIPFLGLDPNNKNTYDLFIAAFAKQQYKHPFFGLKIYPTLGYLPNHPILMDVFEVAAQKQIPITTHCGGASTKTDALNVDIEMVQVNEAGETSLHKEKFSGSSKDDYVAYFNGPDRWLPVLKKYPKLRLNLAHFGSSFHWENFLEDEQDPNNHVYQTLRLVETYDHVFADISYTYFNRGFLTKIRDLMLAKPKFKKQFLFGSDYYMVLNEEDIQDIMTQFYEVFDGYPELVDALTVENPKRFLFP